MKLRLTFIVLLFTIGSVIGQEKFRIDYSKVTIYDRDTKTWSDWENGDNTFVFNFNERGDIVHLMANGETSLYKRLSDIEKDYTEPEREPYQILSALDEDGDVFMLQLFDDPGIGLKMIWEDFIIQFADF